MGHQGGYYACPICGILFDEVALDNGSLTGEHVPPEAVGGKMLILTCKKCNNISGTLFDAALAESKQYYRQAKGIMGQMHGDIGHVTVSTPTSMVNANLVRKDEKARLQITGKHNDPSKVEELKRYLLNPDGVKTITISSKSRLKRREVKIAYLRSAFLILAARFGYTVALCDNFEYLRPIFIRKTDGDVPLFYVDLPETMHNSILIEEKLGRAFLNIAGQGVIVPWPSRSLDGFGERAVNEKATGFIFDFPTSFCADLDHAEPKHVSLLYV